MQKSKLRYRQRVRPMSPVKASTWAGVDRVFGKPYNVEGMTVIPVARIRLVRGPRGFVYREVKPAALIEVTERGVQIKPVVNTLLMALAGILLGAWNVYWVTRTIREWRLRAS